MISLASRGESARREETLDRMPSDDQEGRFPDLARSNHASRGERVPSPLDAMHQETSLPREELGRPASSTDHGHYSGAQTPLPIQPYRGQSPSPATPLRETPTTPNILEPSTPSLPSRAAVPPLNAPPAAGQGNLPKPYRTALKIGLLAVGIFVTLSLLFRAVRKLFSSDKRVGPKEIHLTPPMIAPEVKLSPVIAFPPPPRPRVLKGKFKA